MRGESRESTSLQRHSRRRWTACLMYSASIPEIDIKINSVSSAKIICNRTHIAFGDRILQEMENI